MNETRLSDLTTTAVGGPVAHYIRAETETELIAAVDSVDQKGSGLLIVGGGSNILASDEPFPGTVVHVATQGIEIVAGEEACQTAAENQPGTGVAASNLETNHVLVRVAAGHPWDAAVAWTVEQGLAGLESLSGIPGTSGATPVQNVGAYGSEVSQTIEGVHTWDRHTRQLRDFTPVELGFSYRDSLLKRTTVNGSPRYVVLSVTFRLSRQEHSMPVRYGQLAAALGVAVGDTVPLARVRETVLDLRASKGMVLDPTDRDTFSTGSFFTNPVLPQEEVDVRVPRDAPRFPVLDAAGEPVAGLVKLSAAWLIDHAGFGKGFGLDGTRNELLDLEGVDVSGGRSAVSTKHTLAMTNRGEASAVDMAALARSVRGGVESVFGVRLVPEPVMVGFDL